MIGDVLRQYPRDSYVISTDQQAVRPGLELVRVTKSLDVAPDVELRLLRRVFRVGRIAQDAVRDTIEPRVVGESQRVERSLVARLCAKDQVSVHVTTRYGRRPI